MANMDEETRAAILKIAAALDKTSDSIKEAPANMARNNSRERSHEVNITQHVAAQAINAVGSERGTMSLLSSIPIAGGMAAAAGSQLLGSNAWQQQQAMPYKKAEDYAKAAGEAGVELSEQQSLQVRDYYRRLGRITTQNVNLVAQQNSILGEDVEKWIQKEAQQWVDRVQMPKMDRVTDMGAIIGGAGNAFERNRSLHRAEMEGK